MAEIIFYPGMGKRCPKCLQHLGKEIWFANSVDLASHMRVCDAEDRRMGWKPSGRGDGKWWCPIERDPLLVRQIQINGGTVSITGWDYSISANGKWLQRRPAMNV